MNNGGQVCISIERVYVEEPVYDAFVAKVVDKLRALRQGVPAGPGSVDVGAMTFPPQIDIVERPREGRRREGREVLPAASGRRGAGASSSRPCSSTSTTRWSA